MAEIEGEMLISDGAMKRPGQLADQLDRIVASLQKIIDVSKKSEANIAGAKTASKVSRETNTLVKSQRELAVAQEKAAKIAKVLWLSENEVAESQKRAAQTGKNLGSVVSDLDKKMASAANSATALGKAQKESNIQAEQSAKVYKAEAGSLESLTNRRIQLRNAIASQKKDQKEDADLLRRGIISRAEFNKRMAESEGIIQRNTISLQNTNKAINEHILINGRLAGEYKRLSLTLESARMKLKDMAASGTASSKALRDQQKVVEDLDRKIKAIDASAGQFQRNVGNYPRTFGAATDALSRFMGAFGLVTGIALFAKLLRDSIALTADFEYKNSTLMAVLGETREGIKALTDQQLKYGEVTLYTANQVADLQIIYSKAGLTTSEIKGATEATLDLATATGEDLAKSADVVTTILRSFQISAGETGRVVDVMTGAFNKTTLGLENFFEAMKYVAPIAKANNISFEETSALLGTLADAGIRGSMAGTSLRKIISDLDKGSGTLSDKLKRLAERGYSSADAMDEVGRTAYASLITLVQNTEATDELNVALHNVNGTAKETARIMADNLAGDTKLLVNATQSLVLAYQEELNGALRSVVQSMTGFVMIIKAIPSFLKENRTLLLALAIAIIGLNAATIKATLSTLAYELAMKRLIIQERLANLTTKQLWATMAANPFGVLLVAIAAVIAAIEIYDRNSQRALDLAEDMERANTELAYATDQLSKAQRYLNISVEEYLKMTASQKDAHMEQIAFQINHTKALITRLKAQRLAIAEDARQITSMQAFTKVFTDMFDSYDEAQKRLKQWQKAQEDASTADLDAGIKNLEEELKNLGKLQVDLTLAQQKNNKVLDEEEKKRVLEAKKAQLDLDKYRLERQARYLQEIIDNENNAEKKRLEASFRLEKVRQDIIEKEREKELLYEIKKNEIVEKTATERALIEERSQEARSEAAKRGTKERDKISIDSNERELKEAEEHSKLMTERIVFEAQRRADMEVQAIKNAVIAGRMSREKGEEEILKMQRKIDEEMIRMNVETLTQMLHDEEEIYYKERRRVIEQSDLSEVDKRKALADLDAKYAQKKLDIEKDLHDAIMRLLDIEFDKRDDRYDDEIKTLSKIRDAYTTFATEITGIYDAITQRRVDGIDKEIAALDKQTERQLLLAGDSDRRRAEIEIGADKRRQELEKKKAQDTARYARFEKAAAILAAGLNGSLAVLNQLAKGDPYTAIPRAIAAGALAAVQVAAIAMKPIPQYAEGGKTTSPVIIAGEEGIEHYRTPSGREGYTPATASVMSLPVGTEITPHKETMERLALQGMQNIQRSDRSVSDHRVLEGLDAINNSVKKIKMPQPVNLARNGHVLYEVHKEKSNFIKRVRSISLGKWVD